MKRSLNMMSVVLVYLFAMRIVLRFTVPVSLVPKGLFFDTMFMGAICLFVALALRPTWLQKTVYSGMVLFWTLFVAIDGVYHTYFETLTAKVNLQGLTLMSTDLAGEYDLSIPAGYVVLLLCALSVIVFIIRQKRPDRMLGRDVITFLVLAAGPLFVFTGFRAEEEPTLEYYQSDTFLYRSMHDRVALAEQYGYFTYHLGDLFRVPGRIDEKEAMDSLDALFKERSHTPNAFSGIFAGANLVVITVESLDSRFIDEDITPTLYTMFENGIRFDNFFVPVFQQGATCNSEFMAVTGLYGINSNDYSNNVCHAYKDHLFPYALPAQLSSEDAGYDTYYFHAGYRWFYHRETLIPNYGFSTAKFIEDVVEAGHEDFNERFDTDLVHFLDFVDFETDVPFYLHFLTYGLHGAYNQTDYAHHDDRIQSAPGYEDIDESIRVYMQKMIEFDIFLDLLVERLQDEGRYEDTLIVIHTDHYPFMLDRDVYADFLDIDFKSIERFRQSLILFHPGHAEQEGGSRHPQVGATLDLAPTLLNLIHPHGDFTYFLGNDLFSVDEGAAFLHDFTVTDGKNTHSLLEGFVGDEAFKAELQRRHVEFIDMYLRQVELLETDYFRRKQEAP